MPDIETRTDIDRLMRAFYKRALTDQSIGYIFTAVAKLDLETHLPIIGDFWESVLFGTGTYQARGRNPLVVHASLDERSALLPEHFQSWLAIFNDSVDAQFDGPRADLIKSRADSIAANMQRYLDGKCSRDHDPTKVRRGSAPSTMILP